MYGDNVSRIANSFPITTFWDLVEVSASFDCTLYPVIPSPTSSGAPHVMLIDVGRMDTAFGRGGLPGNPNVIEIKLCDIH